MEHAEATGGAAGAAVDALLVERALALLEDGQVADARSLLAAALAGASGDRLAGVSALEAFPPLADAELESAFEEAEPERDSMIDADGIAFEAIRRARLDEPENVLLPAPDSPFHTRTMADLLERQGDTESAQMIRSALGEDALDGFAPDADARIGRGREQAIQTLERWLARLRGGGA